MYLWKLRGKKHILDFETKQNAIVLYITYIFYMDHLLYINIIYIFNFSERTFTKP